MNKKETCNLNTKTLVWSLARCHGICGVGVDEEANPEKVKHTSISIIFLPIIESLFSRMEIQGQGGGSGSGGGGGGQLRRLHIIYFLSRKGLIEHPHLIRVHHLSRNGVRLRDFHSYGEKKASMKKDSPLEIDAKEQKLSSKEAIEKHPETTMDVLRKPSSEIEAESPPFSSESSTLTYDSVKLEEDKHSEKNKEESDKFENSFSSIYSNLITKKNTKNNNKEKATSLASSSSLLGPHSPFTRSKSYSSGASHMFRNLIKCGAVDTNDSAMVLLTRSHKNSLNESANKPNKKTPEICTGGKLGGSERIFGTSWNQHHHSARMSCDGLKGSKKNKKSEFSDQKPVSAAYKPVKGPNCSQCGKMFKPEKMHAHMKSCKGMKAMAKVGPAAPPAAVPADKTQSIPGLYLTY
ncbi:hypothetical protein F0562_014567 [Nyssa sinensis]|uniref:SOSEKI DIX-like domain-containing protein n=1 Tax=Nyssa sinensis TaxID=561372 RepID=A0A5J4ZT98_9ASTE|nr:hypothetical protein F0562_014567 [Nyssa sinensis]